MAISVCAITIDGMNTCKQVDVKLISVWVNKLNRHPVCTESVLALLEEAKTSRRMTIDENGVLDAYDSTPLYTNGQKSVKALYVESRLVWFCGFL